MPEPSVPVPTRLSAARLSASLACFRCLRCGRCCEGSGTVRVNAVELEAMAALLGADPYEAAERYTRLSVGRDALELVEREDGACIFLEEDGSCRVQAAKPRQCRDFPFTWRYPGFERRCAGMQTALCSVAASDGGET